MTIELVDGKAGVAHISSEDKAIIHQAKFSKSDVVFDWGDAFKCSMSSPKQGDDRHRLRVDSRLGLAYHGGGIRDDLQRVAGRETQ